MKIIVGFLRIPAMISFIGIPENIAPSGINDILQVFQKLHCL